MVNSRWVVDQVSASANGQKRKFSNGTLTVNIGLGI